MDRWRKEEIRRTLGITEKVTNLDQKILKGFGHVERMNGK